MRDHSIHKIIVEWLSGKSCDSNWKGNSWRKRGIHVGYSHSSNCSTNLEREHNSYTISSNITYVELHWE